MSLYRVRMTLARDPEFPGGSNMRGYDLILPLGGEMTLDPVAWKAHAKDCLVHRFWEGEEPRRGLLRHANRQWFVDYDVKAEGDEEPFFKLDRHAVKEGDYLSITEQDGEMRTFHIVSVKPLSE